MMESVPGAVATGYSTHATVEIVKTNPVATALGTDLIADKLTLRPEPCHEESRVDALSSISLFRDCLKSCLLTHTVILPRN